MMKKNLLYTLCAALALGCSVSDARPHRETEPRLQVTAQVESDALALNVFRELAKEQQGSIAFSPASLEGLLRLLKQGARGQSAAELEALPMGKTGVATAMQPVEANALFIGENFRLKPGIKADEIIPAPLITNPDRAAEQINNWANKKTRGMIPSIISPDVLKQGAPKRMVATNAVVLEEKWLHPFLDEETNERYPFTCEDGSKTRVPMMFQKTMFRCAEGSDWRAVALFYRTEGRPGEPGCFLGILPKGDARAFVSTLTAEKYSSIRHALATATPQKMTVGLPRFELRTPTFSLTNALKACGLRHIFSMSADLSGFADEPLFLEQVLQRCYVKADEQGVQAAAVTAGIVGMRSVRLGPPPIVFDRPFVWAITDLTSPAAPLFMGIYTGK